MPMCFLRYTDVRITSLLMINKYFYHDETLKRKWKSQEFEEFNIETNFGNFTKERYPFGYRSAFIFIDHCDFDTPEKVKAIFYGTSDEKSKDFGKKGIVGTGLTATKTVFIDAGNTENIGLENSDYRKVIERLNKDGVEIVPHSLTPRDSLKKSDFRLKSYLDEMAKFNPKTWTDHGYGLHNIIRFGWCKKNPYFILDELYQRGYRYFWSRIDYSLNAPDGNLNVFNSSGRTGIDYLKKVFRLIKNKTQLRKIIFVFFWDFTGCLIGWEAKDDLVFAFDTIFYYLKKVIGKNIPPPHAFSRNAILRTLVRIINPLFYCQIMHNFFFPDKVTNLTQGFYPVDIDGKNNIFFFDSFWVNDCDGVYSPQNIDRLIKEKGLHIGHNYFCVDEKHYLNLSFKKIDDYYYISDKFQQNLEYLAKCQKENKVWVTNTSKFGDYYSAWSKVQVEYLSDKKLFIKNNSNDRIDGLTFSFKIESEFGKKDIFFSKRKIRNYLIRQNEVYFWFDLKGKEEIYIDLNL